MSLPTDVTAASRGFQPMQVPETCNWVSAVVRVPELATTSVSAHQQHVEVVKPIQARGFFDSSPARATMFDEAGAPQTRLRTHVATGCMEAPHRRAVVRGGISIAWELAGDEDGPPKTRRMATRDPAGSVSTGTKFRPIHPTEHLLTDRAIRNRHHPLRARSIGERAFFSGQPRASRGRACGLACRPWRDNHRAGRARTCRAGILQAMKVVGRAWASSGLPNGAAGKHWRAFERIGMDRATVNDRGGTGQALSGTLVRVGPAE